MAVKTGIELIKGMRYKLHMMGIPVEGHMHVRADNMSVVNITTKPESMLKKKSNAIAYHFVKENVANRTCKIALEPSKTSLADLLMKIHTGTERAKLALMILF